MAISFTTSRSSGASSPTSCRLSRRNSRRTNGRLRTMTARGTARVLLSVTILYNVAEGIIAIASGIAAGSIALIAFGADSYLEVGAAAAVLWRIAIADPERGEAAEQRAMRLIGWTFLGLSVAIVLQAATAFS